jgi:hypothetical protein
MSHVRQILSAAFATLLLFGVVSAASANSLGINETETTVTFTPVTFSAAGSEVSCNMTLAARLIASTITKRSGRVGEITQVELGTCTGGSATALSETLPWSINYVSFKGTLPAITSIRTSLVGSGMRISTEFATCLAGTTEETPSLADEPLGRGGGINGVVLDETVEIPLRGGFLCELSVGHVSGTGSASNGEGGSVVITLI